MQIPVFLSSHEIKLLKISQLKHVLRSEICECEMCELENKIKISPTCTCIKSATCISVPSTEKSIKHDKII